MKHPDYYETDEQTSKRMSHVSLKRGKEEVKLSTALWKEGYRYYLNYKKLPGSPDIAIKKYKIAVFVDGEFWHGYDWENKKGKLKRNRDYWILKIEENIDRDKRNDQLLKELGWTPIHFWSLTVKNDLSKCIDMIKNMIQEINIK